MVFAQRVHLQGLDQGQDFKHLLKHYAPAVKGVVLHWH